MAGSKRWFRYTTDLGQTFAINLDESNTEAVNGAAADVPAAAARPVYNRPAGLKPRRFVYTNASGTRSLTVTVLTPAIYAANPPVPASIVDTLPEASGNLIFERRIPETTRGIRWGDTGLTGGDADPVPA